MRAAVYQGTGKPLQVRELPRPQPQPGEVLIRVRACGVCGSDLHFAAYGLVPEGSIMGHEFAGEIVTLSPEAEAAGWRAGDRVTALPYSACGSCEPCLEGRIIRCRRGGRGTGLGRTPGAYAEYVRAGMHSLVRLPDGLDWRRAATTEPLAVGLHAMSKAAIAAGDRVLILGGGPIGLTCALWARFLGAGSIGVSEPAAGRRAIALRMGATHVFDPASGSPADAFVRVGGQPDIIVEAVGVPGMLQQAFELAPAESRLVVAGVCMQPDQILPAVPLRKELSVYFTLAYTLRDFQVCVAMLAAGRIDPSPMITGAVDLDGLPEAFAGLSRPSEQAKIVWEAH